MLSGPSFSFRLTFLHLAEVSLSAFSWLYTLMCEVAQKYPEMYFTYNHFYYSFCNQPALFAQLEIVNKLWNNNHTVHVNERNQNKKSCLIQIEYSFHCLIYPTNNTMVSLKDGFTVWRQSQKEDFLSTINYINVWLSMMLGHGANPIFFNNKKIKIGRPEHFLTPPTPYVQ